MKFLRRYNLKKLIILSLLTILVFLFINMIETKYYYERYYKEVNNYVAFLIEKVKENYPNVDEQNLIKMLNSNSLETNQDLLLKYGINIEHMSALKSLENVYSENVFKTIVLTLLFGSILLIIFLRDSYLKNKEVRRVIKTIQNVNAGNYDLKVEENYEGDLSILNDEIYKTTLMLKEKAEQSIKDKNSLKDFIANISHQIKTPLTSILIMVDNLIEEDVDKNTRYEFLKDIRNQIENMNFLIVALLKLSRFDANVIDFKKEKIYVKKLLFNVNKNIAILADVKNINIHLKGNNEVAFIGDYTWETEALTNIIKNCIEHTEENKNIFISYNENHFYTKIVIEDEGKGMSKEEQKKIFQRFYKGKNSSANSIGIGLALAKEIIEKDNGSINVKSEKNKETIFTIKYFKK